MNILLSRAHYPVTVLGPGRRIGLWTQGCGIGCAGCVSRDTWSPSQDRAIPVEEVVAWCDAVEGPVDGITISGGEPFDQPAALEELLRRLHDWRGGRAIDLLCYSGRSQAALRSRFGHLLERLDAVIPGPFVAQLAPGLKWRGSTNQELVPLSPLGHERYDHEIDAPADRTRLQVSMRGDTVYQIGVPRPGDLEALERALARRGVAYTEASWRS
ncbi:radical activating enzyme [Virgisporangium aliadipatigenens]|uniref:Radical activating enzyme n=1 Tax=Virgisporangium aliadipatigenens TaxID=741659 RepID=A0A8J4DSY3_9ACTN|nr:4Fe-4S single cluster domain-containing protein [Virgisporangium aliadipatigenens]GIJ48358.1 radical activating enzyme [Virgisporangium aliadipatigenens]